MCDRRSTTKIYCGGGYGLSAMRTKGFPMPAYLRFHLGLLLCLWCTGCQQTATAPSIPSSETEASTPATRVPAANPVAANAIAANHEYWDAIYFGDSHVG